MPAQRAPEPAPTGFRPRVDRTFREQVEDAERDIIQHVLAHTHDNVTEAARILDLERGHFYKKMKALGLRRGAADKEPTSGSGGE
jgi:DNA-binding NtrC family response regulator